MKPRAVLVTPVVPAATGNGLSMRAGVWLEGLARTHDVDLIVVPLFPAHASAPAFARRWASRITIAERATEPGSDGRLELTATSKAAVRQLVSEAALVVAFRLYLAHVVDEDLTDTPSILDLDDIDWVREHRLGNRVAAQALAAHAEAHVPRWSVVTSANAEELDTLPADLISPAARVLVPNPSRPARGRRDDPNTLEGAVNPSDLVFVGTLGYEPNARGLLWFADEVLPALPGVTLTAVGALPHAELIERASDTFRVVGNVDDVSSWYQRARVAIVPLHAGSGSRIKIVEAWAHRRPVVSTSIGAEGLGDARERGALIVADSAAEMAAECERLLGDPELARTVAERGFELYCERYTLKSAFVRIDEAVRVASEGGVS